MRRNIQRWRRNIGGDVGQCRASPNTNQLSTIRPLLCNAKLIKEEFGLLLKSKWLASWFSSPRKGRMDAIDPNFPFNNFWALQWNFTRAQSSILFQIRLNHLPLNTYLNWIGKSNTKFCMASGRETAETVTHYLLKCPSYNYERHQLDAKLGQTQETSRRSYWARKWWVNSSNLWAIQTSSKTL